MVCARRLFVTNKLASLRDANSVNGSMLAPPNPVGDWDVKIGILAAGRRGTADHATQWQAPVAPYCQWRAILQSRPGLRGTKIHIPARRRGRNLRSGFSHRHVNSGVVVQQQAI